MSRTDRPVVLDSSAVLALLHEEPGADEVEGLLEGAAMSTVNLSEVLLKSMQHRIEAEGLEFDLQALGLEMHPFDVGQARVATEMWERAPGGGLSLGDRACLALAEVLGADAVTTDRRWSSLPLGVDVRVVR